ncbi:MAG: acetyl-CoA carboxylase biotin carboxyl carrier protein subunit [Prevotella sp.]|nr:acetyl-CoA carboxylase biotin carboxyl carrier protein subunit [Prevotella sp.]
MKLYKYTINGNKYEVEIGDIADNIAAVKVNGEDFKVEMEPEAEPEKKKVVLGKPKAEATESAAPAGDAANVNRENAVKAPLPGTIIEIKVAVGDEVQAGDTVIVLEAMKMANNLEAEKSGKVTAILVQPGQSVMEDDALVVIE